MILYFTGTGNSKYCADYLAEKLADKVVDLNERIRNKDFSCLESEKCYMLCAPTYAWRIPNVVTDYLKRLELKGSDELYFVMTCGGEIGKAEKYNIGLCSKIGKKYKGTVKVKMPENYLVMFDVTDEKREEELMVKAVRDLDKSAELISQNESLPEAEKGIIGAFLSGVVNPFFYPFFVKDKKFTVSESCISCGICAKKCPLNNIDIKEGKPIWKGNCTHCMACISYCPEEAIEYGNKSRGQRRYRCRSYK